MKPRLVMVKRLEVKQISAAWLSAANEAGFEYGLVVVPVVFEKREWEDGPERYSLLSQAVHAEGIPI